MSSVNLGAQHFDNNVPHSTENVNYSLKQSLGINTEDTKSLVRKITELERINDDLRAQIRHPGQKHKISLIETQKVARKLKRVLTVR